jgi:nicotinamide mononucleotide transporter
MLEASLQPAFTLWGSPASWLEVVAFVASLAMVWCNLKVIHWGWPLAIVASALYGYLFAHSKLYGEAALQVFFIVVSFWGWGLWLYGRRHPVREVRSMRAHERLQAALIGLACVVVVGVFLTKFTDSDVPWLDAAPTGLSLLGQWLLARKRTENWPVWLVVNVLSCGLFAYRGLWLTVVLYASFAVLSVAGWHAWRELERTKQISVLS